MSLTAKIFLPAAFLALLLATPPKAEQIAFDGDWKKQGFSLFSANRYGLKGSVLEITSNGTVSLLWRAVFPKFAAARKASWQWAVQAGVEPTDLTVKGGDDRNAALYFVFTDKQLNPNRLPSVGRLLRDPETRALVYVWGGNHPVGSVLNSPYAPGLRTVVLRETGTGEFTETVDLARDYSRAFGGEPGQLVGIAVSADSDDTDGAIKARIGNLEVF